jgi:capsular exopolysaccharide synthesis family protein
MLKIIIANFHLEKILWIIKKNIGYMVFVGLVAALLFGGYAYATRSSVYQAKLSFYAYSDPNYVSDTSVNITYSEVNQAKNLISSYTQILKSDTFLEALKEETGLNYSTSYLKSIISTSAVSDTAVFYVYVLDSNPVNAQKIANAIGELAPDMIVSLVKAGGVQVLDSAKLPTTPYKQTNVGFTAILGFLFGCVAAFVVFIIKGLLNTTIRRKYEIEDMFSIPILGDVPEIEEDKTNGAINTDGKNPKFLSEDSSFAMNEAYNAIRTKLLYTGMDQKCPIYGITSADSGEGKSLNSINLSISYSHLGKKVLLIDGDLRKSGVQRALKKNVRHGLSQYLGGINKDFELYNYNENLDILFAGEIPPNPMELLSSDKCLHMLEQLQEEYDVIFIDFPPVGEVADALALANTVTSYILVVRENLTKFDKEESIIRSLEPLGADICGFIYNGIATDSREYKYNTKKYGEEYGYGFRYNTNKEDK